MVPVNLDWLKIPRAVAASYARPGTDAYEELVAVGNLEVVRSAGVYDPERGEATPESFIYGNVRYAIRGWAYGRKNHQTYRWAKLVPLDEPGEDGLTLGEKLPAPPAPAPDEGLERLLAGLSAEERGALYARHVEGRKKAAMARERGVSIAEVTKLLARAERNLRSLRRCYAYLRL